MAINRKSLSAASLILNMWNGKSALGGTNNYCKCHRVLYLPLWFESRAFWLSAIQGFLKVLFLKSDSPRGQQKLPVLNAS